MSNPEQPERTGLSYLAQGAMIVGGVILLLPGICAVFFMAIFLPQGGGGSQLVVLWLICLAISAGGVALIVWAARR